MDARAFLEIMHVAEQLKNNTRHSWTSANRHESVAEHSWRMTMMAYFLKDEFPDADIDRVILMCMFHDMGEAFTGDIPTFLKTQQHEETEQSAIDSWIAGLPGQYRDEVCALFAEMDAQQTPEARIYKAIDKLEVLIQHNEAELSTWIPKEYEMNVTYADDYVAFSDALKLLREEIRRDTIEKIGRK